MKTWIDALNHLAAGLLFQGGYQASSTRVDRRASTDAGHAPAASRRCNESPPSPAPADARGGGRAPCPG